MDTLGSVKSSLIAAAEGVVNMTWNAIKESRPEVLGAMLNISHGLLSAIGVSTLELEELVYIARSSGALGAKLTGAGMGGSVLAVAHPGGAAGVVASLARRARWVREVSVDPDGTKLVS